MKIAVSYIRNVKLKLFFYAKYLWFVSQRCIKRFGVLFRDIEKLCAMKHIASLFEKWKTQGHSTVLFLFKSLLNAQPNINCIWFDNFPFILIFRFFFSQNFSFVRNVYRCAFATSNLFAQWQRIASRYCRFIFSPSVC